MRSTRIKSTKVSAGLIVVLAIFMVTLVATSTRSAAQTLMVLHSFDASTSDGKEPSGGVTFAGAMHLYGTTVQGGTGLGTVFELAEKGGNWTETVPNPFDFDGTDGSGPSSHLLYHALTVNGATSQRLYGTTANGGAGYGTVFELTYVAPPLGTGWTQTFSYSFSNPSTTNDGQGPGPNLVFANGNIYGTTSGGGSNLNCGTSGDFVGCGTVFQLTPATTGGWTESVVYNFLGNSDAQNPVGIVFSDNVFYGTAAGGSNGEGRVFELDPTTWTETALHDFTPNQGSNTDGAIPAAGLVVDTHHNLYGTTSQGGTHNAGVVFELSPLLIKVGKTFEKVWIQATLHDFDNTVDGDGGQPSALTLDKSGNLYGTTEEGGPNYGGTVFELQEDSTPPWNEIPLHSFCDAFAETCTGADATAGQFPSSGVVLDNADNVYGTTLEGGANGEGTVFAIISNDFGLSASPLSLTVTQGGVVESTMSVADVGSFAGTVKLTVSGLPKGVTASFSSTSITGSGTCTLTLTASPTAKVESGKAVTITGTSGTLQHTATIIVNVS
jgi:uncharacterized repeat protein (TIGR03803 family)